MDDWWASVGSDNFNRRSWTHDSELSAVVIDTSRDDYSVYARRLRLLLAAEHLDRELGDAHYPGDIDGLTSPYRWPEEAEVQRVLGDCIEPEDMFDTFARTADALDAWHANGRRGQRPPGRLRRLAVPEVADRSRVVASPIYGVVHDPDGRPDPLRRRSRF